MEYLLAIGLSFEICQSALNCLRAVAPKIFEVRCLTGLKGGLCSVKVMGMKGCTAQNLMNEKRSLPFGTDGLLSRFRWKHWANGWKKGFN
jgi:hypothetical protein